MSGHVEILVDQKSDAKVMPKTRHYAKTDVRFWKDTIFHRKRGTEEDANWTVQIQYLKRREQVPLDTPNKDAAAAKARDIYLSLHSRGWVETLALYKPQPQPVVVLPEHATVGDLIREVSATTSYRITTFYNYISSQRFHKRCDPDVETTVPECTQGFPRSSQPRGKYSQRPHP